MPRAYHQLDLSERRTIFRLLNAKVPAAAIADLSGDKRRPELVVSRDNGRRADMVVCFITSVPQSGPDVAPIAATPGTGLKVPSVALVCGRSLDHASPDSRSR